MALSKLPRYYIYLLYLPVLIYYLGYIYTHAPQDFYGDEPRYISYATHLTQGFYTSPENPEFLCGPGYPMFLTPFIAMGIDWIVPRMVNACLLYGAVLFFFFAINSFSTFKSALFITLVFALYPFTYRYAPFLLAESLSFFFNCGFIYFLTTLRKKTENALRNQILAAFFLAGLMLTKVFFAYVVLGLLISFAIGRVIFLKTSFNRVIWICLGAFLFCIPYLHYTYKKTHKIFYWSTSGGEQLYWRSSPYDGEFGDWISPRAVLNPELGKRTFGNSQLTENHLEFYRSLPFPPGDTSTTLPVADSIFKVRAIANIKEHPEKYVRNTVASFSRLFFDYPLSYTPQKMATLGYIFPNMFLLVLSILFIYPVWIARHNIPIEIWTLIIYLGLFIGGMSLLNGRIRHLTPIIPTIIFLLGFSGTNLITIKINKSIRSPG